MPSPKSPYSSERTSIHYSKAEEMEFGVVSQMLRGTQKLAGTTGMDEVYIRVNPQHPESHATSLLSFIRILPEEPYLDFNVDNVLAFFHAPAGAACWRKDHIIMHSGDDDVRNRSGTQPTFYRRMVGMQYWAA